MAGVGPPLRTGRVTVGPALGLASRVQSGPPLVSTGNDDSASSFTHVQTVPASVIAVKHDLGFRPNVSLFNTDYSIEYDEFGVQHLSVNELRVSMDMPTACVVVMS